jgi:hypothetical protein
MRRYKLAPVWDASFHRNPCICMAYSDSYVQWTTGSKELMLLVWRFESRYTSFPHYGHIWVMEFQFCGNY